MLAYINLRQLGVTSSSLMLISLKTRAFHQNRATALPPVKMLQNTRAIPIRASDNVDLISSPSDFYLHLQNMIRNAKERIVFTSLYLGTGEMELKLVSSTLTTMFQLNSKVDMIREAMRTNPSLKVHFLLDCLRGSRLNEDGKSSVSLLHSGLFQEGSQSEADNPRVFFYHTPELNGLLQKVIPQRYNEIVGVSHLKAYLCDDDIILSGANLSANYFTNRQDRYIKFRNTPALCEYYHDLVETVSEFSFQLQSDGKLEPPAIDPVRDSTSFKVNMSLALEHFIARHSADNNGDLVLEGDEAADTFVYPLLQAGFLGIRQDEDGIKSLFSLLSATDSLAKEKIRLRLATGYFNMYEPFESLLLKTNSSVNLLCASTGANGFNGARGPAGFIPLAYAKIQSDFFAKVKEGDLTSLVHIWEYDRPGWTFHAKGFWMYKNDETTPFASSIGSSNYGYRSSERDLENEVIIQTTNEDLKKRLHSEMQELFKFSAAVQDAPPQANVNVSA